MAFESVGGVAARFFAVPWATGLDCRQMNRNEEIVNWWDYLRAVLLKPSWEFITTGVVMTILYVATWWRDNLAPEDVAKKWAVRNFIPNWSFWSWLCIVLGLLLFRSIRVSYALWKKQESAIQALVQPQPLPDTAPQLALRGEDKDDWSPEPIRQMVLKNISKDETLYNFYFHPRGVGETTTVVDLKTLPTLSPGQEVSITPTLFVQLYNGTTVEYVGLAEIYSFFSKKNPTPSFDIAPLAFDCEDSRQNRYMVTFTVSLGMKNDELQLFVRDCHRIRVDSRRSSPVRRA